MAWTAPRTWVDGELVTAALMNTHVRDNLLVAGSHLIARKTSDQSVTSSTVMVDATSLVFAVAANEVWQFEFNLIVDTGPGGMDIRWTFPTSGYISASGNTSASGFLYAAQGTSPTTDIPLGVETAGVRFATPWAGVFVNSTNAGNVQLQFAQNTSDGTGTIIKANSTIWAVKLA